MKTGKTILAMLLIVRLLLGLCGGMVYADAVPPPEETTVEVDPTLAFAPFPGDANIAYVQDGSIGIFYLGGLASLIVRVYGTAGKPISLFAENGSVSFTALQEFVA